MNEKIIKTENGKVLEEKIAPMSIKKIFLTLIFILIFFIFCFLFYWYEIRPARIYSYCNKFAQEAAVEVLKDKAEFLFKKDPKKSKYYKQLAEKGMYLRSDYEYYFKMCLRRKGIIKK